MSRHARVSQSVGQGESPRAWIRLLEEHAFLLAAPLGILAASFVPGEDGRKKLAALFGGIALVYLVRAIARWLFRQEYEEAHHRRRAMREGRSLVREAHRILNKRRASAPAEVVESISGRVASLAQAVQERTFSSLRAHAFALDEALDSHFPRDRKSTTREYAESIGLAVLIALLLRSFVVEAFKIPSGSMIPTLQVGDHIFVKKYTYGLGYPWSGIKFWQFDAPKRGDVIVFKYPKEMDKDFIKRVVAIGGDTVFVQGADVFINGQKLGREHVGRVHYEDTTEEISPPQVEEKLAEEYSQTIGDKRFAIYYDVDRESFVDGCNFACDAPIQVPPGHVFVMGDNRDNSSDSRIWGFVPDHYIKGRAWFVWLSLDPVEGFLSKVRVRRFGQPVK